MPYKYIPFARQDLQDIHDIFCLSREKAKTLIPLRGKSSSLSMAKVGKTESETKQRK